MANAFSESAHGGTWVGVAVLDTLTAGTPYTTDAPTGSLLLHSISASLTEGTTSPVVQFSVQSQNSTNVYVGAAGAGGAINMSFPPSTRVKGLQFTVDDIEGAGTPVVTVTLVYKKL